MRTCRARARRLRVPEFVSLQLVQDLPQRAVRSCWRTPRSGWRCASSAAWPSNARCWRAPRRAGVAARWPRPFRRWCCWCCTRAAFGVPLAALVFVAVPRGIRLLAAVARWRAWRSRTRRAADPARRSWLLVAAGSVRAQRVRAARPARHSRRVAHARNSTRLSAPAHWQATRAVAGRRRGGCRCLSPRRRSARGAWLAARGGRRARLLGGAAVPRRRAAARGAAKCSTNWRCTSTSSRWPWKRAVVCRRRWRFVRERAPRRRAAARLGRVILEIHAGTEPLEALRALEQRSGSSR